MESTLTVQFYAEIARRLALSSNLSDAFEIINDSCLRAFKADQSAIFTFDTDNNNYIRKSLSVSRSNVASTEFPHYLKLSQLFAPYSQKKYLVNALRPSPFFEEDAFTSGSEVLLPVRIDNRILVLIVCRSAEKISLPNEHEIFCEYLEYILATTLHRFTSESEISLLKNEIRNRDVINHGRLQMINDRLRKSNQELKQFAYTASHDLQEPLRMVTNYINLFYKYYGPTLTPDGKEYLDYAKDGASRMHMLIKDLLTYAKLDYSEDAKQYFSGSKMLGEALKNLQVAIEENEAIIFYRDIPELYGNENQIVCLFQNLVDNAIKYKGENYPDIFIDVEDKEEHWNFSVKDNGIGIDQQFHEKIFEFFSRLHAKDEYKGTGLGLSICKKIIDKHSGTLTLESEPGKGSNFKFSIAKA
ncbi:MAG: sensor histidine kinase [Chitinophagales bacterium]